MKKIYIYDPGVAKTLNFLYRQAEEALGRDPKAGHAAVVQVNAYIARNFPEVRAYTAFGLWTDDKGLCIVCFATQAEHAAFIAEIMAADKCKMVAHEISSLENLDKAGEELGD